MPQEWVYLRACSCRAFKHPPYSQNDWRRFYLKWVQIWDKSRWRVVCGIEDNEPARSISDSSRQRWKGTFRVDGMAAIAFCRWSMFRLLASVAYRPAQDFHDKYAVDNSSSWSTKLLTSAHWRCTIDWWCSSQLPCIRRLRSWTSHRVSWKFQTSQVPAASWVKAKAEENRKTAFSMVENLLQSTSDTPFALGTLQLTLLDLFISTFAYCSPRLRWVICTIDFQGIHRWNFSRCISDRGATRELPTYLCLLSKDAPTSHFAESLSCAGFWIL